LLGNIIYISLQEQFVIAYLKGSRVRTITMVRHALGRDGKADHLFRRRIEDGMKECRERLRLSHIVPRNHIIVEVGFKFKQIKTYSRFTILAL